VNVRLSTFCWFALTPRGTRWLLYLGASGARGNGKGSFFGILELRGDEGWFARN